MPQATPKKTAEVITNHPEMRIPDVVLNQLLPPGRPPQREPEVQRAEVITNQPKTRIADNICCIVVFASPIYQIFGVPMGANYVPRLFWIFQKSAGTFQGGVHCANFAPS